jgi:phosphoribosyl 1,2-cyclic phosphodiesterase
MFNFTSTAPDITVHALASGSSGNAMLVQGGGTSLLIDAGLGVRALSAMLAKRGVVDGKLDAVLLTHEHTDHSIGAGPIARRTGARIVANRATLSAYGGRDELGSPSEELATGAEIAIGAFSVRSFPVPHDAAEPVGYVLSCGRSRIAYVTDAGCRTAAMAEALRCVSLAIVEANHDLEWLRRGPYSPEMKARVASSTGHLCNDDCADLLAERLEEGGPTCVWLAHLSRVNNSAALARRAVRQRVAARTSVPFFLEIALRDQPSVSWRSAARAVQLSML